jgi:hypothetical protein
MDSLKFNLARMMLKQLTSKAVVLDVEKYGCHDKMLHCLLKKLGNNSKCDYDISSVTKNNVANWHQFGNQDFTSYCQRTCMIKF